MMSDLNGMQPQPELSAPGMEAQIEIIWQMGLASLSSNNNELVLPQQMALYLSPTNIEDLKLRLSRHIDAPTISFVDQKSQVFRICRVPSHLQAKESPAPLSSPETSTISRSSATPTPETKRSSNASSRSGKGVVPRPANAFILFRKDRHQGLKQSNPTLHNNDISIMLGKEWKEASEEVKADYKARAERIKHQHALENPGYQYAPRKPGDKKRRMTKKKLAHMRSANATNDIAEFVRTDAASDHDTEDEQPNTRRARSLPTAENYTGTRRSPHVSHLTINNVGNIEVTLPSNNPKLFSEVQAHQNQHGSYATVPFNSGSSAQVLTSVPQYSQNDDTFLNSLINWQGIANDNAMLKEATAEDLAGISQLHLDDTFLDFAAESTRTAFDEEITRTMGFF